MLISIVIPAFNASKTILHTLNSVMNDINDHNFFEVIVVNDGSNDSENLVEVLKSFPKIKYVQHDKNLGMCAGRNTGIMASIGEYVTILDADDEFVSSWSFIFNQIIHEWPSSLNVCFAKCINLKGDITAQNPDFSGELTLIDILNERNSGEYLPIFRGEYIRRKLYTDLKMRKSCGIVSYISFALDSSFWVSSKILRIYNDESAGSVSSSWLSVPKATETLRCYEELFKRYTELYKELAPEVYNSKMLRYAVYMRFARVPGSFRVWMSALSLNGLAKSIATGFVLLIGPKLGEIIILLSKKFGLLRKYG